jgi:hypothetical protein
MRNIIAMIILGGILLSCKGNINNKTLDEETDALIVQALNFDGLDTPDGCDSFVQEKCVPSPNSDLLNGLLYFNVSLSQDQKKAAVKKIESAAQSNLDLLDRLKNLGLIGTK